MRKASAKFVLRRGETCEPPNRECSALGLNAIIQSSYNEMLCLNGLISIRRISIRRIESRKLGKSESGVVLIASQSYSGEFHTSYLLQFYILLNKLDLCHNSYVVSIIKV